MMQLLAQHVARHFKKKHRDYVFADELLVKVQRARKRFPANALPLPTIETITAWTDLPNVTVDNLALSVKAEMVFLRAPPPTPMIPAFDTDAPTPSDLSSDGSLDGDGHGWVLVDEITLTTPDPEAPQALEGSVASEDDTTSRPSDPDQPTDRHINEENSSPSTERSSLSSDQESLSSRGGSAPIPVGFPNMVHQWLVDYSGRGMDACVDSLIAFGVVSVGTTLLAARIARDMVKAVEKRSHTEGKALHNAVRFSALAAFKKYWGSDGHWRHVPSARANTAPPMPYGVHVASLIGSLFGERLASAQDVHLCLSLLSEGEKRYDRLCAMHALLVQANDKLCKNRNLPALMQFRDGITSVNRDSGDYLWATSPHSNTIITDILATIERWLVTQAIRREECRMNAWSGRRSVRSSAVGPRGWVTRDSLDH